MHVKTHAFDLKKGVGNVGAPPGMRLVWFAKHIINDFLQSIKLTRKVNDQKVGNFDKEYDSGVESNII